MSAGLPVVLRLAGKPVIVLGTGEAAAAKRRLVERAGAIPVAESGEARLAVVALDEPDAAVARLRARGILVNAVDRPDLCDFTFPAIVERGPVLVAVSTGGVSAGLAAALRQRIEALLPSGLGALAEGLAAARATLRGRLPDAAARRRAIGEALSPGGPLDPLVDHPGDAAVQWSGGAEAPPGRLVRIAIVSDDPDALTLAQARALALADHVVHTRDVPAAILARARADAVRSVASAPPPAPAAGITLFVERAR